MRRLIPAVAVVATAWLVVPGDATTRAAAPQPQPLKIFISVDMEGIGGIGTSAMTTATGKDYALGRRLMTDEVNTVIAAIKARGPAEILVNDSHGDMQNLLHTDLPRDVTYIQGAVKPVGMVAGLDSSFRAAIFVGYHSRAGTPQGFLAHTGTGSVKGLWLNDVEVGEGELNAAYAGALGVPVILASGDEAFVKQFTSTVPAVTVTTKTAITPQSAMLRHPSAVSDDLRAAVGKALDGLGSAKPWVLQPPIRVRLRLSDPTIPQVLTAIPGVTQVDGFTVAFTAEDMTRAYKMIRLMYRYVSL
jgi:D-amino peptidase